MKFVYILESEDGDHFYVGVTEDVQARVKAHNAGNVSHTSKFGPWRVRTFVGFDDDARALAFERYLKSGWLLTRPIRLSKRVPYIESRKRKRARAGWG